MVDAFEDKLFSSAVAVTNSIVWNQEGVTEMSFSPHVNSTLNDTMNEAYVTAQEDSPSQYLSVLDNTNEISLDNLNMTVENTRLDIDDNVEHLMANENVTLVNAEEPNEEVTIYALDDEYFGIQVAQDEEGNFHRYQFQFRKRDDGELEALPETFQLLVDEESELAGDSETIVENPEIAEEIDCDPPQNQRIALQICVEQNDGEEQILPDNNCDDVYDEYMEDTTVNSDIYEDNNDIESVDIKPDFLHLKQEIIEESTCDGFARESATYMESEGENTIGEEVEDVTEHEPIEEGEEEEEGEDTHVVHYDDGLEMAENTLNIAEESEHLEIGSINDDTVEYEADDDLQDSQQQQLDNFESLSISGDVQIQDNNKVNEQYLENASNNSDNEEYEIVEGLHITGDAENNNQRSVTAVKSIEKSPLPHNINILKNALKATKEAKIRKESRLLLYFVHPEKENVDSSPFSNTNIYKPLKTNPRSILKSSHPIIETKNTSDYDERLSKRFARGKEATQARIFHNFITKTTIPQAPVRTSRLPRKQEIKPVERLGEEIVVQEVMISSNGFVEANQDNRNKKNLRITEYVDLTDSDEEYQPAKKNKKVHQKQKSKISITISDTEDESTDSIIELDVSDNEKDSSEIPDKPDNSKITENNTPINPTKRRRGRPPKNPQNDNESDTHVPKTVQSASREPDKGSSDVSKSEIPCTKCSKTFPSQNSLKTHLQHHNLQSTFKKANTYKCDKCNAIFKNSILLKRHACSSNLKCPTCKTILANQVALNNHKRLHAKTYLLNQTLGQVTPPKRIKLSTSPSVFKNPPKTNGKFSICHKNTRLSQMKVQKDLGRPKLKCSTPRVTLDQRRTRSQSGADTSLKATNSTLLNRTRSNQTLQTNARRLTSSVTPANKTALSDKKKSVTRARHCGIMPSEKLRRAFAKLNTAQLNLGDL